MQPFYIFLVIIFLKDLVRERFLDRFKNLEIKFKKSEFYYLLFYRFCGGIPWQLSCVLPVIFNVKIINFFFSYFNWHYSSNFLDGIDWKWIRKSYK